MAHCIAFATGIDKSRVKKTSRLGSIAAEAEAATYRTFAVVHVRADGSGEVQVKRDGIAIISEEFGPEEQET